jgi:hypothetical protein
LFGAQAEVDRRCRLLLNGSVGLLLVFEGGAFMPRFRQRFAFSCGGCALVAAVVLLTWALATGSSEAQSDSMNNCPQAGRWSIAVWGGPDGTETGQALATCGAVPVAAAYYLDPQTQGWSYWFAGRPEMITLTTLDNMQGVIALGGAAVPTPAVSPTLPTPTPTVMPTLTPTVMPGDTWTGTWDTTYGNMQLSQSDGSVTGTYEVDQGTIEGTVQGNKLIGTWHEGEGDAGEFEFTLSPDGNSFVGGWRVNSSEDWTEWTGTRVA